MAIEKDAGGKVGIGIIGTGAQGGILSIPCMANPYVEIVGLAEIREGVVETFAERLGIQPAIFKNYRELLAMDGLDAVIVTTPNDVHAEISIAAIEAGKHTLCEKPMTSRLEDAKAMVEAEKAGSVCTMVGYTKRFFRGSRFIHDFLRREDLGRVYHVRAFYFQSWLCSPRSPRVWRLHQEKTGTGALGDLASHVTDLSQHLVGDEIVRVSGMMQTFYPERPSITDPGKMDVVDVDDGVVFGTEYKNGALGVVEASRNATGHPDHWRVEILCRNGGIVYDNVERRVQLAMIQGPSRYVGWTDVPMPAFRYGEDGRENQNEIDHFVDCIRSGQPASPSFAEAYRTERVLDAARRSAQSGTAVDID